MAKIRFQVPHRGFSFLCIGHTNDRGDNVRALNLSNQVARSEPRVFHVGQPEPTTLNGYTQAYDEVRDKLGLLSDLLHAGLPWDALVTCRRSPGAIGAIIEACEERRAEAARAIRLHRHYEPPLSGAPAARNWSRESSK